MSIKAITYEPIAVYRKPAYDQPGYSFRVTNLDEVNTVYFETDNLTITSSASSPLPQQASVTFDGTKSVWMSSGVPGRVVQVDFSPSSLTYDNPVGVQIALNALGLATAANQQTTQTTLTSGIGLPVGAAQESGNLSVAAGALLGTTSGALIANPHKTVGQEVAALIATGSAAGTPGGTPLLHGITADISNLTVSVPANSTVNGTMTPVSKPGYIISLSLNAPVASTVPFAMVSLRWFDPTGGIQVGRVDWVIPGNTTAGLTVAGEGPCRGAQFRLTFTNLDGLQAQSVNVTFLETTHHIARDDWRLQAANTAPPTYTWAPGAAPAELELFLGAPNIPATTTNKYLLPLFAGPVSFFGVLTPAAGGASLALIVSTAVGGQTIYDVSTTSALTVSPLLITLPREPCLVSLQNSGSAQANALLALIAQEFVS